MILLYLPDAGFRPAPFLQTEANCAAVFFIFMTQIAGITLPPETGI